MTEASRQALVGLRDPHTLQWYVVPLLALLFYIYASELKKARATGDWNPVLAGLTLFGMDFINESINGWILVLSDRSALWTAPGPTALRTMVGWNVEIMFMFAIAGIVYCHTLSGNREARILGVREPWFWAAAYSAFSVLVELVLNAGGLLIWDYRFWDGTPAGVWLIFLFGYFHFYVATLLVIEARTVRTKLIAIAVIYAIAIALNVIGLGVLGWTY